MKVLITGITGLIGSHLARYLAARDGIEVFGFKRWRSPDRNLRGLEGRIHLLEGDIQDPLSVYSAVQQIRPEWVYHLAAQSYPKESLGAPHITLRINVEGTLNLLEAMRQSELDCRIHIASSSAVYGFVSPEEVPVSEEHPPRPLSPYGVSKVAQELLAYQYYRNYGLKVYMVRFFNQAGPGQGERSAIQTFCQQVARIELGKQEPILYVGNLEPKRDYTDIRDTVRALWLHLEKGRVAEIYNIGSGKAIAIGELLELILGRAKVKPEVRVDPARLRPTDEPILEADISKFQRDTGWEPRYTIEDTVDSVLEYWRSVEAESLEGLRGDRLLT